MNYLQVGFGSEILLGLRTSNDFGPVVTFGGGGLDVEYLNTHFKAGHNLAILPSSPLPAAVMKAILARTAIYGKIAEEFRGQKPLLPPEKLLKLSRYFRLSDRIFSFQSEGNLYD